ncbi:RelA/SpoT domain-containing protein [Blautia sp. 2227st1_G12_2227SCRN_220401]|mgnify:FL=1|uniref:RelA/SpoT domain-containing protein n=1 Tax=Blautia TaxID=572511 RepID=UPI0011CC8923
MNTEDKIVLAYLNPEKQYELKAFLQTVLFFFENNPALKGIVHSVKSRMKDPEHLKDKIQRKLKSGKIIDENNLFTVVNDLIGVRVLYLYQDQFQLIHNELLKKVDETKDWMFVEAPKAYTWDPETREYFEKLNIHTEVRDTYYTSVHYVIKPNNELSNITCEIQVRTLFEEIWGEIDHTINYPHQTEIIACKEQLRVLAKLVSTGTRLADSIFRTYNDVSEK